MDLNISIENGKTQARVTGRLDTINSDEFEKKWHLCWREAILTLSSTVRSWNTSAAPASGCSSHFRKVSTPGVENWSSRT